MNENIKYRILKLIQLGIDNEIDLSIATKINGVKSYLINLISENYIERRVKLIDSHKLEIYKLKQKGVNYLNKLK